MLVYVEFGGTPKDGDVLDRTIRVRARSSTFCNSRNIDRTVRELEPVMLLHSRPDIRRVYARTFIIDLTVLTPTNKIGRNRFHRIGANILRENGSDEEDPSDGLSSN